MAAVANVAINVDSRDASRKLREVANRSKEVSKAAGTASSNIQRFGVSLRSTVGPLVALTAAATFLGRSLSVLGSRQADAAALANGLEKLGKGEATLRRLQKSADELGKATLFDQEDFDAGFKLLTSFRKVSVDSYERVAEAAADVAQITGQDVKSALLQLSKALEDPAKQVTALARSGTVFTEQQKEQIKTLQESGRIVEAQNLILKEIEAQYGGAARAAGSAGYAGAVDSLGESFRDFQERVASGVEPAVVGATRALTDLFDVLGSIPEPVGQAALGIGATATAILAVKAAAAAAIPVVKALFALVVANPFIALAAGVTAAAVALAGYRNESERIADAAAGGGAAEVQAARAKLIETEQEISLKKLELEGATGRKAQEIKRKLKSLRDDAKALRQSIPRASGTQDQPDTSVLPSESGGDSKAEDKLKKQLAAGARLAQQFERQKMLLQASNDLEQSLLRIEFSRADAIQRINETAAETQKQDLIAAANAAFKLETLQKIDEFGKSALEQADALINRTNQQIADEKRREELIAEGINPALADELVKIESTFQKQQEKLEAVKLMLQSQLALIDATSEEAKKIQEVIDKIKEKQQVLGQTQQTAEDNAKETDEERKAREKAEKLKAMMKDLKENAIASVATALEDALVTTIEKAITGAEDLGEALQGIASSLLKDLGRMFIRAGIGGLMGFADGGFAQPGKSYVVGERGPELLTMSASGGYVTSNSSSEAAMDRYSGNGGNGGSISVNYNVTEINQMKFVTEDQFRAGITQAAKQGADGGFNKTMTSLKNNRSTRSRVGI